ncbi:MAG: lactate racemase domain-containing protein, partial [Candidatus Poribacteria bacterium]
MIIRELELSYGDGKKLLHIKDENLAGFLKPIIPTKTYKPSEAFKSALDNPIDGQRLEDLSKNKKVCVTIEDYTRSEPHYEIVLSLSKRLTKADFVQYIVVTGTHNPKDERNLRIKYLIQDIAKDIGLKFDVSVNDSRANDEFDYVGTTERGTKVFANKKALDAELFVTGADMKPHYFAGYSAANKHFLPGMCAFETTRVNHCGLIKNEKSNYGRHPWHYDKDRQENPLSTDMIDAMLLIAKDRPIFTLALISDGDILWSQAGLIEDVTKNGIRYADEVYSFRVKPVRYLIVSPGGLSEDSYLYSGQRALELTSEAVQQGGEVLWI